MQNTTARAWVDGLTVPQVLAATVERYPDRSAVLFPKQNVRWTWAEFAEQIDRAARGLSQLGIRRGDHVAIWATNVPQWLVTQYATAQLGAVLVTVNPAYRPFELQYVLRQSDAAALLLVDRFKSSDYFAMLAELCPALTHAEPDGWQLDSFPKLRQVIALQGDATGLPGLRRWNELLELGQTSPADPGSPAPELTADDPINIQYTSGTTGFPKAAMLSHRNLLLNAWAVGQCQRLTELDRLCVPVPFYHCFGCVMGSLCCTVYGATIIVPGEHFHPADTLDAIESHRATVIYGVPTMFIAELEDPSFAGRDLSSLRTGIMAGSPCPIQIMRQVVQRMGAREMTIAYGQTEASPVVTQTTVADPIEVRVETVGRPIPGAEVKVVDPLTGEPLADEQIGELCSRGPMVMLGYYNDPAATAAAIDSEGWLHSGDLALRLPSGYYRITGRLKDMVIRGGENIYPREIEEFLFTHPDVEQTAVVGLPDAKFGEELCAWVKLRPHAQLTEDQLRDFCRQHLAHYKVPRYIRFVREFPQTVTGKVQKFKIREHMLSELGLEEPDTA